MTNKCRKCGGLCSPKWIARFDVMQFICSCGYVWTQYALDKAQQANKMETILVKEHQGAIDDIQKMIRHRMSALNNQTDFEEGVELINTKRREYDNVLKLGEYQALDELRQSIEALKGQDE